MTPRCSLKPMRGPQGSKVKWLKCREAFYGRFTATTPTAVTANKKKTYFFKSKEITQKKDDGPEEVVLANKASSVTLLCAGYKLVRQFSLPADTVRHTGLPPRLSAISCFLSRLPCVIKGFLSRLSARFYFLQDAKSRGLSRLKAIFRGR